MLQDKLLLTSCEVQNGKARPKGCVIYNQTSLSKGTLHSFETKKFLQPTISSARDLYLLKMQRKKYVLKTDLFCFPYPGMSGKAGGKEKQGTEGIKQPYKPTWQKFTLKFSPSAIRTFPWRHHLKVQQMRGDLLLSVMDVRPTCRTPF